MRKSILILISLIIYSLTLAACSNNVTPDSFPTIAPNPSAAKLPSGTAGPVPGAKVVFPNDEAPHNDITEWWYYTGHLKTADGHKYGFEFVVFQSLQSNYPAGYVSHFAITNPGDNVDNTSFDYNLGGSVGFEYDQRAQIVDNPKLGGKSGFNLAVADWKLQGLNGNDHIQAGMTNGKYAVDLNLKDNQGVALHGGGEISYGPSGASYYYSRPFMTVDGSITVNGQSAQVTGQAWFDHQWGNFISIGGGGWDWFSTQLSDGTALMFYNLRGSNGELVQVLGSYILPCTQDCSPNKPLKTIELTEKDLSINPTQRWTTNFKDGIAYPVGWKFSLAADPQRGIPELNLNYKAALPNQELDTTQTTKTIYWEGDEVVWGTKNGKSVNGAAYVELTGYTTIPAQGK